MVAADAPSAEGWPVVWARNSQRFLRVLADTANRDTVRWGSRKARAVPLALYSS